MSADSAAAVVRLNAQAGKGLLCGLWAVVPFAVPPARLPSVAALLFI